MDYFKDDFLIIVDESHITIPQVGGMYAGDQSRKSTLVDYGFRLPSAKDNRPLNFGEFEDKIDQMLFVSATPNVYEGEHELLRVEQIIRPTGLLDPEVDVRPVEGQIDDLIGEVNKEVKKRNKVLITTLTKKMAEDLTDYMKDSEKNNKSVDFRDFESVYVRDFLCRGDNLPVRIGTSYLELVERAINQNFIPVIDDRDSFIGIVTRKSVIRQLSADLKLSQYEKLFQAENDHLTMDSI
jgi:CBS domain-containing protein